MVLLLLACLPGWAWAAEKAAADKSVYTLANPTPPALLRDLSTDRPDATESPFTVDAGHVQLEMDFAAVARDRESGTKVTSLAVAPFNLRLGLLPSVEAGVFFDPFLRETVRVPATPKRSVRGHGDTVLRLKVNFWGNDGGENAGGMIADCKLPTATRAFGNDKVEGALTFPVSCELGGGWELGAMTAIAAVHDGNDYQPVWSNTITVAHDLVERVGAFWEITSQAGDGAHVCTFDTGLSWQLNRDTQLDVGVNLGVSRSAPDVVWFAGLSRRF